MKIILLQDVAKVGRRYNVKEVAEGYARNFLMPRGFAEVATPEKLGALEEKKKQVVLAANARGDEIKKLFEEVGARVFEIKAKADEKGHLFAAVKAEDISQATRVPAEFIELEHPIKQVGDYEVKAKYQDTLTSFTVRVAPS